MKSKAGITKTNALSYLTKADAMEPVVEGYGDMYLSRNPGQDDEIRVRYGAHKVELAVNEKWKDRWGRVSEGMVRQFSIQWFKSGKIPKRKKRR
jgi:predicted AAA+ superfamily ATPase